MIEPVRLSLPYPPSTNRYWRNWRGRMVIAKEAREYKARVAEHAALDDVRTIDGWISLRLYLRPKARKTERHQEPDSHRVLDIDNACKIALDALQGVLYADDKQVVRISVELRRPCAGGALEVVAIPVAQRYADA